MQGAGDLDAGGDLAGGFQLAQALVAGGDDLGEILVERQGADVGEEGWLGGGVNSRAKTLDEGGVFLQRRVEGFADWKNIFRSDDRLASVEARRFVETGGWDKQRASGREIITTFASPGPLIEIAKLP